MSVNPEGDTGPDLQQDIFRAFRASADPARALPMRAYMRDQFPFLGIGTPQRRQLERPFLKTLGGQPANWPFLSDCWAQPEREFQYLACDVLAKV
ncbi:MAG: DNA alkylation repair protein, partial [Micrococcales bacterium]|nr:DNA alkylation repair protein [Micrococcales bacterium]